VYESGESLVVQPNAPHTFFNKSEHPCRMLSVSTYHHERGLMVCEISRQEPVKKSNFR
jgi:mannose-6-phosphate isomerase-like protein (cupin superfamily)